MMYSIKGTGENSARASSISEALHTTAIPNHSSPPGTVSIKGDWIYRLEQSAGMQETMLGKMVRDMESTFGVVGRVLQVSGKASLEKIKNEQGIFKLSAVVAALFGNVVYGTSLLTLAIIKTVVWVPMIALTTVLGGAGAILLHGLEAADQRELAQGTLDVIGGVAVAIGEIIGFFTTTLPYIILICLGSLGAAFIEASIWKGDDTAVGAKLLHALIKQVKTSNMPIPHSFIPEGLKDTDKLTNYFCWMNELGVDFNETKFFNDKQTLLLLIRQSNEQDAPLTGSWDKNMLLVIKKSLEKASIWDTLLPETQRQINESIR